MKCKIAISLVITLLLATMIFAAPADQPKEEKPVKCPGKVSVLVKEVIAVDFQEHKMLNKEAQPLKTVEFISVSPGAVKAIVKAAGSNVVTGDVVLRIDEEPINKEIKEANAFVAKWKRILKKRAGWKVRSQRAEQQAQNNITKYEELVTLKKDQLTKCEVKSPITGIIDQLKVKEGDTIEKDFILGTIVNIEKALFQLTTHADKVKEGAKLKLTIKELNKDVEAVVRKSTDGRTFLAVDNADESIKPGMTGQFQILFQTHENAVVLAENELITDTDKPYVYVVNGNRARKALLQTGHKENSKVMITQGLNAGDEMITHAILSAKQATLRDDLTCLEDNKKITVMIKNDEKGKFVKRKKKTDQKIYKEPTQTEKPKAKPVETKTPPKVKKVRRTPQVEFYPNKFRMGAHLSYYKMSSSDFEDTYHRLTGFGLDFAYFVTDKIDVQLTLGTSSKTASVPDFPELELKFKFVPVSLDVRYYFKRSRKFDLFAGTGLNYYSFEENNPIIDVKDNAIGFNLLAGGYYHLTRNISVGLSFRYNIVKKTITDPPVDNQLDLSSAELLFGISYGF